MLDVYWANLFSECIMTFQSTIQTMSSLLLNVVFTIHYNRQICLATCKHWRLFLLQYSSRNYYRFCLYDFVCHFAYHIIALVRFWSLRQFVIQIQNDPSRNDPNSKRPITKLPKFKTTQKSNRPIFKRTQAQ